MPPPFLFFLKSLFCNVWKKLAFGSCALETRGPTGHISGPHVVRLSITYHLFGGTARAAIFVHWSTRKKIGRGRWDLASCQVSLNSFLSSWIPSCQVSLNSVQWFPRRSRKWLSQSEARQPSCFSLSTRGRWGLASKQFSLNSVQQFQRRSRKFSANQRSGGHLDFPIGAKNTW